jgi:cytochrome c-type biogenesis protein CcmH
MLFWIAAALLTIFALALVFVPLMRGDAQLPSDEPVEVALYRSQLASIADEQRAGRMDPDEAETTRTEVKRRMLAAGRFRTTRGAAMAPASDVARTRRLAVAGIGCAVPLIAVGFYLVNGRPDLPDRPFAARAAERAAAGVPSDRERALVAQLAERMSEHPEDPKGWVLLGGAYVRQGRYDDAVSAFQSANAREPNDAAILSALAEALVLQAGGEVDEDARLDFQAAVKLDPKNVKGRYFVALADAQAGNYAGAILGWSAMLGDAPANAPWRDLVQSQLERAKTAKAQADAELGPGVADAAANMSPQQRQAMIEAMVASLAAKLASAPDDLNGWLRLSRSYAVLGEPDKAKAALNQATEHFRGDQAALAAIEKARAEIVELSMESGAGAIQ